MQLNSRPSMTNLYRAMNDPASRQGGFLMEIFVD